MITCRFCGSRLEAKDGVWIGAAARERRCSFVSGTRLEFQNHEPAQSAVELEHEAIAGLRDVFQDISRYAIFQECPQCGGELRPEHAHYKCDSCGWRDSCCD